jgi:hypothetical protein
MAPIVDSPVRGRHDRAMLRSTVVVLAFSSTIGCKVVEESKDQPVVTAVEPWEPIDPGFSGCEGG